VNVNECIQQPPPPSSPVNTRRARALTNLAIYRSAAGTIVAKRRGDWSIEAFSFTYAFVAFILANEFHQPLMAADLPRSSLKVKAYSLMKIGPRHKA
jgi:hypothetical protein